MPDKNIVILKNGNPSEERVAITKQRLVTFYPTDSDHRVTITFAPNTQIIPFIGWTKLETKGDKGKPLVGIVRPDIRSSFFYQAASIPPARGAGHVVSNPELIVDGGRRNSRRGKRDVKQARSR